MLYEDKVELVDLSITGCVLQVTASLRQQEALGLLLGREGTPSNCAENAETICVNVFIYIIKL